MTDEKKLELFEAMLKLEHKAEEQDEINFRCKHNPSNPSYSDQYFYECNGAFEMLRILGLSREYIQWSIGK